MLKIIICTHSNLAMGLKDSVTMILGNEPKDLYVMPFLEGDDMMEYSNKLKKIAEEYEEKGEKYVFLVDLYGATPFNASAAALANFDTKVIAGVNLGLLLELVVARDFSEDYDLLLKESLEKSKDNMKIVGMREMFE
ncbi:PTS sugar transporter subunit IIA [Clostridium sp. HCS.1]|uniref:PTS sugar transporter subunit IIA n=1 Tax=Clostridium sp. HCS.1 TaxID=3238594 RepID=UPI003A0FE4CA